MEKNNKTRQERNTITRDGVCGRFCPRRCLFAGKKSCWYCVFAGFDLSGDEVPESGECCYPVRQTN